MDSLQTLQTLVDRLDRFAERECILEMQAEGVTRWRCAEVAQTVRQLAAGLAAAGLQPGQVVTLLAGNRAEWVMAALAVILAGGVVSPLDSQLSTTALERVLQDSKPPFIFTTTNFLNRLKQFDLGRPLRPILFDVADDDERGWRAMLSEVGASLPPVEPESPAALFYTSGTTGVPKGVLLTHRNLAFQIQSIHQTNLIHDDDRVLLPLPMYHVYPFTVGTLIPISFGLPIILPQSLTGPQVIRALREGEATIMIGVPRLYRAVYNGIEGQIAARGKLAAGAFSALLSLSVAARQRFGWQMGKTIFRPLRAMAGPNLRLLTSGGSALDPELGWKLEGLGWDVGIGYGLTETSPMLTINLPTPNVPRLASVGQPLPGIELRLAPVEQAEEEGPTPVANAARFEGEIQARGISVFSGYRNLPQETEQAFTADGWFRTGDLGYQDDDGYLYISGRASTLIVLEGGKKIQPDPLEDTYQQNQFIREIGILYEDNQLCALVVPEIEAVNRLRNGDVEQAIREAVNERVQVVPSYQRITDYAITETPLPRTNLGKIRRHTLREFYGQAKQGQLRADAADSGPLPIADMTESDQALLSNPAPHRVWDWLASRYPDKQLTPDTSPQLDLGIDSLEWLTLTLQVSDMTGVELSDEAIGRVNTVRDLLQEIEKAAEGGEIGQLELENVEEALTAEQKKWLEPPPALLQALGLVVFYGLKLLAKLFFRLKARGLENLPTDGNYLLTPNHSSMLDAPMVAATLSFAHMRQTHWAGATDIMLTNPVMRLISRMGQLLPVDRYGAGTGIKNLALAVAVLRRQKNLVWFPEGRISTTDDMLPFREGIGIVLQQQPTPVVPVLIQGTRQAMPVEASFPGPGRVTITFGQPCDPRQLAQQGHGDTEAARIVNALQQRLLALRDGS